MRDRLLWPAGFGWLAVVSAGFAAWHDAGRIPHEPPPVVDRPANGSWTLTMFVHPHCPCSRPALAELKRLVAARDPVPLTAEVVFVRPSGVPGGWERGRNWDAALHPGVARRPADGEEARRAGAVGSGHVLLADPSGRVVFRGGLRPDAVRAWVAGEPAPATAPVVGCSLLDPPATGG
jgi:hypothetical protein